MISWWLILSCCHHLELILRASNVVISPASSDSSWKPIQKCSICAEHSPWAGNRRFLPQLCKIWLNFTFLVPLYFAHWVVCPHIISSFLRFSWQLNSGHMMSLSRKASALLKGCSQTSSSQHEDENMKRMIKLKLYTSTYLTLRWHSFQIQISTNRLVTSPPEKIPVKIILPSKLCAELISKY